MLLCGGTALARVYLHHRVSYDLDFFIDGTFDPDRLAFELGKRGILLEGVQTESRDRYVRQLMASIKVNDTELKVSFSKIISKRLKSIQALFLLSGYKPLQIKHQPKLAPENLSAKNIADNKTEKANTETPPTNLNPPEENLAPELDINLFPTVEWTNELSSPQLSGRAAEYIESSNLVLANADFKGFKDLIQYFLDKYAGTENLDTFVVSAVNEVVEQALMECVAGALSLRDQPHWNPHQSHLSLTTEAITMAMMQRYWMANFVDQKIRQELLKTK